MLLDTIEELARSRPLAPTTVEKVLGTGLRVDPDNTNPYLQVFRSFRVPEGIREVEVRVPLPGSNRKDSLVIVELTPGGEEIHQKDVLTRFGKDAELMVPTPREPPESPIYLSYKHPWGVLRFGFARPSTELLTTVVVDAER